MYKMLAVLTMAVLTTSAMAAPPIMAESSIAPDPLPAQPEKGPWLFCYFYGNGDGLHLAASTDGLSFTPLNHDKIYLKPIVGNGLMRDPCIRQGPGGMYYLVWTTGWWDKGFGVAASPDLIHWSEQAYVEVNKDNPTAVNTWAPELFYNDQKKEWMIFWATTIPGRFKETEVNGGKGDSGPDKKTALNHRIYYVTTQNFRSFSEMKLLVDPGFNCIDATIAKVPASPAQGTGDLAGKYVMVLKDETKAPVAAKNLRTLVADNPEGPWKALSDGPFTPKGLWVEGPTVVQVDGAWNVYYDVYAKGTYGAMRTTDFKNWEVVGGEFKVPRGSRHGTVFPVSQATLERLQKAVVEVAPATRSTPESRGPSVPKSAR